MTDKEHKELLEHIVFLKKVVEDAPHNEECQWMQSGAWAACNCWKSKEMVTTPYSIPEKKKK